MKKYQKFGKNIYFIFTATKHIQLKTQKKVATNRYVTVPVQADLSQYMYCRGLTSNSGVGWQAIHKVSVSLPKHLKTAFQLPLNSNPPHIYFQWCGRVHPCKMGCLYLIISDFPSLVMVPCHAFRPGRTASQRARYRDLRWKIGDSK